MKRFIKKSILILCLAVLMAFSFASESVSFLKGDINDDEKIDLSESVHALQVVAGLKTSNMTKIINVPSDFPTIQEAINMAVAGDTINIVAGTYNEKLTIMKSNIKLQGAGRDSTIINGNSTTDPTISILNSTGIEISDFLIKGGRYGIRLQYSSVSCKNNRIENNTKFGVRAFYNSFIEIGNTLIKLTDGGGISVDDGAVAWIDKSEITQNTGRGLSATSAGFEVTECIITNNGENGIQSHDSSVRIYDSVISNNTGDGIDAWNGSRITLYGTEVKSNTDCGLMIGGHSTAHLGRENTISNNGNGGWWSGIFINHNAYVYIGENTNTISANNGAGIRVLANSTLGMNSGTLNANQGDGVYISSESIFEVFNGVSITNNEGYGISCEGGKLFGTPGDNSGNNSGAINGCN